MFPPNSNYNHLLVDFAGWERRWWEASSPALEYAVVPNSMAWELSLHEEEGRNYSDGLCGFFQVEPWLSPGLIPPNKAFKLLSYVPLLPFKEIPVNLPALNANPTAPLNPSPFF
ncbi:hypothetical protein CIHG_03885 [Coccidioides immitis H538.4]|uniref:Uncharacterized protein n=3 Tax=Coccidioides immitis TaxID=5501 RepID=A0A0J8QQW4_COCIT|nr:hypothetical protein CIRG_03632 [Coccidioides immitis RMSCC 2394]KMU74916.1 hypothetical protein CISG_00845 [Coccidioides immitis RMSCC 3703]KMU86097.1 hypothetical protein CIHG_03885 [Coccidioides immitis H538.4]